MSILLCVCYIVLVVSSGGVIVAFFNVLRPYLVFLAVLRAGLFDLFFNHSYHENIVLHRGKL